MIPLGNGCILVQTCFCHFFIKLVSFFSFFQTIYLEEITRERLDASSFLSKDTARKAMQEARHKNIPSCPSEMSECIRFLQKKHLKPPFGPPKEILDVYLDHVEWDMKKRNGETKRHYSVLIGKKELFETVSQEATFYFADGTFSTAPRQARNVNVRGAQVIEQSHYHWVRTRMCRLIRPCIVLIKRMKL